MLKVSENMPRKGALEAQSRGSCAIGTMGQWPVHSAESIDALCWIYCLIHLKTGEILGKKTLS